MCNRTTLTYIDHLIDTLEYLTLHTIIGRSPDFQDYNMELASTLGTLRTIKDASRNKWELNFKLVAALDSVDLCGQLGETDLFLGADIKSDEDTRINQSIGAWLIYNPMEPVLQSNSHGMAQMESDEHSVYRKFHFDHDMTLEENADCHWPWTHLQYGGKCKKDLLPYEANKIKYNLHSCVDFPRLPSPPYDFVLIFDLFTRQFKSELSQIHLESKWKKLVKKSEWLWLEKYYQTINDYFVQTRPETLYEYSQKIEPLA